jgi:flagellar basal body-associated protein FliL
VPDPIDLPPPSVTPDKPPKPQPQPWRASRWLLLLVIVIVVLILVYVGYGRMSNPSTEDAPTRTPDTQTSTGTAP